LTWQYGWYGAATATTASAALGLVFSYYYTNRIISVTVPIDVIGKQLFAAGIMALTVYGGQLLVGDSLPLVSVLVIGGAGVYFLILLAISREFRVTVEENLPFNIRGFGE
jgi:O-antigen/teichoic acid export membrane protein